MADIKQVYEKPLSSLDKMGEELAFYIRAIRATPRSVTRYPKEIMRLLAEVTLGSGALAVILAGRLAAGVWGEDRRGDVDRSGLLCGRGGDRTRLPDPEPRIDL